jgi:6-phosphogluconate dehydrogenase
LSPYFLEKTNRYQASLRKVVIKGFENGLPLPCLSSALAFYDGYRSSTGCASLIQAQRDYFGAHGFERTDQQGTFHAGWMEPGTVIPSVKVNK